MVYGLYNDADRCVEDALRGHVTCNDSLRLIDDRVVVRHKFDLDKVALVTGGGSGHEPSHIGYVGEGMLTAAVCGPVFTSPPVKDILTAIRYVNNIAGILLIVKNYTGDRLNFSLAAKKAQFGPPSQGRPMATIKTVVVSDDMNGQSDRGICGTVIVHKIAGAMADVGKPLIEIQNYIEHVMSFGTIGLGLSSCRLPGHSDDSFYFKQGDMELGLGIHGEAGVKKYVCGTAKDTVETMIDRMFSTPKFRSLPSYPKCEDLTTDVAVFVNNLGTTTDIEMSIVAKETLEYLETKVKGMSLKVKRLYNGKFMTALNMAGVSISVLFVTNEMLNYLDHPTLATSWPKNLGHVNREVDLEVQRTEECIATSPDAMLLSIETSEIVARSLELCCQRLSSCESLLNQYDSFNGDGDCGSTLKRYATEVASAKFPVEVLRCPQRLFLELANIAADKMGGTSGAIYFIFLSAMSENLVKDVSFDSWVQALNCANKEVMKCGGAKLGDKTMVDALNAAYVALTSITVASSDTDASTPSSTSTSSSTPTSTSTSTPTSTSTSTPTSTSTTTSTSTSTSTSIPSSASTSYKDRVEAAAMAAQKWTELSANLGNSKVGRQSYVRDAERNNPDPGCHGVSVWLRAISDVVQQM